MKISLSVLFVSVLL